MVITEAIANGLPVITTNNKGGPAFIKHGRNGFLIPIRDANCLAVRCNGVWTAGPTVQISAKA